MLYRSFINFSRSFRIQSNKPRHFLSRSLSPAVSASASVPVSASASHLTHRRLMSSSSSSASSSDPAFSSLFHSDRVNLISSSIQPSTTISYQYRTIESPARLIQDTETDVCSVVFLTSDQAAKKSSCQLLIDLGIVESIPSLAWDEFEGSSRQSLCVYPGSRRVLLVGLGSSADFSVSSLRLAVHTAIKKLKDKKIKKAAFLINKFESISEAQVLDTMTRISTLSNHTFSKYLAKPAHTVDAIQFLSVNLWTEESSPLSIISSAQCVVESSVLARELANDRGDVVTPLYMESVAKLIASTHQMNFKVLQEEELKSRGLNLICAVGQGANEKARIVSVEYRGDAASNELIGLVGKGITFDTGGLNMKPTNSIETMYLDMHGSASVLAAMKAIAILKPKVNVVGVLALAENAVDALAIKPHAIIRTAKGSVQIQNTDAEGRLALADAFTYLQTDFPEVRTIIDLATLTGACVVALGENQAGLFSNSDKLAAEIQDSADRVYERVWRMPILQEHTDELKTSQADFKSTGGRMGGACSAAAFLQKFINNGVQWSHIDIAGPAMFTKTRDWIPEGGTGFGTQLLVDFVLKRAAEKNGKKESK